MSYKRIAMMMSLLTLFLGLTTLAGASPLHQEDVIPPKVVETVPFAGEELLLDQAITLYFDQPMSPETVEQALSLTTGKIGQLNWLDETALVITPEGNWERGTEVGVQISTAATTAEGTPLAETYEIAFSTVGYLEITDVIPSDEQTDVTGETPITVIFNRPVVPLTTIDEQAELPQPLILTPALEGTGEWLNTSIYIFRPTDGWAGGLEFTATIPAGLTDATGAILQEDYTWSFTTLRPEVVNVYPNPDSGNQPLDQEIAISFSHAMNPEATTSAISLIKVLTGDSVPLDFEWDETNSQVRATPQGQLDLSSKYTVKVDAAIARSQHGSPLLNSWTSDFLTVPYPEIVGTNPENGMQNAQPYGGFQIFFNAPIDPDSIEGKIRIEPEPWREFDTYYYDYDYNYQLYFDTEPGTQYTITIDSGITDPYGNVINEGRVVTYTTGNYDPEVNLNIPSFVGLYSAYNPNTRVFATHRNVSRLDLNLYGLDLQTLIGLTGDNSWNFRETWSPEDNLIKTRSWSVDVQSQPNTRRYELLLLSSQGGDGVVENVQCLGAPATRLQIGDLAMVGEGDPRPLRVRTLPNLQGEVITEIPVGTTFDILDGPICADGYLWWFIAAKNDAQTSGWSAEGTTENYFIDLLERRDVVETEDLNPEDYPALTPGMYYLSMSAPETANLGYGNIEHVAIVADVNITMKFSPTQLLAWVTDMETGLPRADVPVEFYNNRFELVGRINTNAEGIASLEMPRLSSLWTSMYAVVMNGESFGYSSANLDEGIAPWRFGVNGDYEPEPVGVYIYTDRPLYRPNQPVYFRGVLRDRQDVQLFYPQNWQTVPVRITDPQGSIVFEEDLPLTPFGTFAGDFTIADEAALGYYNLQVNLGDEYRYYGIGFNVGEYVAPEFSTTVTPSVDEIVQGETLDIVVESTYFFGGAVSDAKVAWSVLSANYAFSSDNIKGYYDFADFNYDEGPGEYYGTYGEEIATGEGRTDAEGKFVISVPADLGKKSMSQEYTVEARVVDESDYLVAGKTTVIVHQGEVYLGARAEKYVSQAESEAGISVISVDWEGLPVADQTFSYNVVERVWSSVQEEDELGRTIWTWDVEEIELDGAEGELTTDAEGKARVVFTPPNAGTYKVYLTTRDAKGNKVRSSTYLWVSGSQYVSWRQQNSDRFDLITDAQNYEVGDTAQILIASPFQGEVQALVTVERGAILQHEVITLQTNSEVYELTITEDMAPNVFVSVVIVKGVDENNAYTQFRMGLAKLTVNAAHYQMNVEVTPDVPAGQFVGPGDDVTYKIRTTDWAGNPVSAEVGLGVTDKAVLSIASPNSGTLMEYFYSERALSVRTNTALTVSVDRTTQTIIDTVKGGGGGGDAAGIFDIRQEFVDTPGWEPDLVTDENGEGTYTLTLPDNLTTWQLDARAVTDGTDGRTLVGQTTVDVLSTKPLLLRPLTPRFFIVGDQASLGAIVNNNTDETQTVTITLEGTGFDLPEGVELAQTVDIPPKGRQRVNWSIEILDVEAVDLTFYAQNPDNTLTDASKPTATQGKPLPVYKYEAPEIVGTSGVLAAGETSQSELIALPRRFEVTEGELTIKVDRSLAAATTEGLDYLENFPHQCTEQTVSKFLPNVMTARALTQLGLFDPTLKANLDEQVNWGIQYLYANQHVDGGWGWFPELQSNPITSAYALVSLVEARNSGYTIDQTVIDDAAQFLQAEVDEFSPTRSENWRKQIQAFLIYSLTRAGYFQSSTASILYEMRTSLNTDSRAYLLMALHAMNPNDERVQSLRSDLVGLAVVSASGAHWEDNPDSYTWTTDTRSTALGLMALVKVDPTSELIPQVVRWLMVARNGDAWETTQETAWSVMALTDWMVVSGELRPEYSFSVALNSSPLLEGATASPDNVTQSELLRVEVANLLKDQANRVSFVRSEGQGNLYYTAHLEAFLSVPDIQPVSSRGIILDRQYYAIDPNTRELGLPVTGGVAGEELLVVLTIIVPNDLYYVVVEDPIPAGSAAVDPNITTNSILSEGGDLSRPLSRGWGWWWFGRTEYRDEKVVMYSDYLPRGTYEYRYTLRLGLPGTYNVIPPTGHEFYFPEVYGRGSGAIFTIAPAPEE